MTGTGYVYFCRFERALIGVRIQMAVSPFVNDLMFSIRHTQPVFNTFRQAGFWAGASKKERACLRKKRKQAGLKSAPPAWVGKIMPRRRAS